MQKFTFRLERLLRLKEQKKRQAELEQMQAAQRLQSAHQRVAGIWQELANVAAEFERQLGTADESGQVVASGLRTRQYELSLQQAESVVQQRARELHEVNERRSAMSREVEILLHLREQEMHEHHVQVMKHEQVQLDEVVLRQWQSRKDGAR
jgi:flagellar export protein FliJ